MAGRCLRLGLLSAWLLVSVACGRPTPDELLADARAAVAAGETRTAEIHLKNLLQEQPDHGVARAMLGQVLLETGDFAGAEQNLRRALALGTDTALVKLPLARALLAQRKYDAALEQLAAGPQLEGNDRIQSLSLEALAHRGLGARELAEQAYRAALRIDPSSAAVRGDLASMLLESGRVDAARMLIAEILADQPDFAPVLLLRGNLEARTGDGAAAEVTLQHVVDLERAAGARSPVYSLALGQLAETQLGLGKVTEAAASTDALLAANPRNPVARLMKAAVEVQQNDLDGAERRLEALIADAPEYWPAYRLLGAINVTQNQAGQATMYLRNAVTNNPADTAARLQLAELYIREGNIDGAKELIAASPSTDLSEGLFFALAGSTSRQAGLSDQAAQLFDQSEQAQPDDVRQLVGLSRIYTAAGEFERAVRVLQSASFDDAQSELLRNYLLALVQVRQGDLPGADATAQRLVDAQPTVAWPLSLRGSIALLAGNLAQAQELLAKALEIEPQNTGALLNSARVAAARNDRAQAEQYLQRVIDIEPANTAAAIGLAELAAARRDFAGAQSWVDRLPVSALRLRLEAELLAAQGRTADAAVAFARAFDAQPSAALAMRSYDAAKNAGRPNPEAKLVAWNANNPRDPSGNFALGSIELEKGQYDAAIGRYEAVLAVNPGHAATLNNLSWLYSQRGDARALDFAERAYGAEPNNPSIADTLGWLYVQGGDARKALPLLEAAAAGLSDQAEVRYHWAVALAETGDTAKALATLDAVLASGGNFPGREDAQTRAAALRAGAQR